MRSIWKGIGLAAAFILLSAEISSSKTNFPVVTQNFSAPDLSRIAQKDPPEAALSGVLSTEEVNQWMTYYYLNPRPELVPSAIVALKNNGTLSRDTAIRPLISFFSFVFRDNPSLLKEWFDQFPDFSNTEKAVLIYALWFSDTPEAQQQLTELLKHGSIVRVMLN